MSADLELPDRRAAVSNARTVSAGIRTETISLLEATM